MRDDLPAPFRILSKLCAGSKESVEKIFLPDFLRDRIAPTIAPDVRCGHPDLRSLHAA
jgi:hypothetical protein